MCPSLQISMDLEQALKRIRELEEKNSILQENVAEMKAHGSNASQVSGLIGNISDFLDHLMSEYPAKDTNIDLLNSSSRDEVEALSKEVKYRLAWLNALRDETIREAQMLDRHISLKYGE